MPARTGEQFLKGLRGPREIWVDGERVSDVVDHPKLRGAAHALAEVFDLQHKQPDICLTPDSETGEPIAVSHVPPRSRADLQRRHKALALAVRLLQIGHAQRGVHGLLAGRNRIQHHRRERRGAKDCVCHG